MDLYETEHLETGFFCNHLLNAVSMKPACPTAYMHKRPLCQRFLVSTIGMSSLNLHLKHVVLNHLLLFNEHLQHFYLSVHISVDIITDKNCTEIQNNNLFRSIGLMLARQRRFVKEIIKDMIPFLTYHH